VPDVQHGHQVQQRERLAKELVRAAAARVLLLQLLLLLTTTLCIHSALLG